MGKETCWDRHVFFQSYKEEFTLIFESEIFGSVEVDESKICIFEKGLPGFPDVRRFVPLPFDRNGVFSYFHSLDHPSLCFVIMNPFVLFRDYEFQLSESVKWELDIAETSEIGVYVIVTLGKDLSSSTANLRAPLVVNLSNGKAKQVILEDSPYAMKELLGPMLESLREVGS